MEYDIKNRLSVVTDDSYTYRYITQANSVIVFY